MSRDSEQRMRCFVQVQMEHVERQNVSFSEVMKNQVLEYAMMIGDRVRVRALVKELTEAAKSLEADKIEHVLWKAQHGIDFLPDPLIGVVEMRDFGYSETDMYPLRKEEALKFYQYGYTLYCLYPDNTEQECISEEMLKNHDGIYGIAKDEWHNMKCQERLDLESEWFDGFLEDSEGFVMSFAPWEDSSEDEITAPYDYRAKLM